MANERHNPKNELQELATGNKWALPTYNALPGLNDRSFRFEVLQTVEGTADPLIAQGEVCSTKKDAQKSAAAAMLVIIAQHLEPLLQQYSVAPDYELPWDGIELLEQKPCFVSSLNMLCQGKGWRVPDYKRMPLLESPTEAHNATYVTINAGGSSFWARTTKQGVKEARQECAGRLLLYLAVHGKLSKDELPAVLQVQAAQLLEAKAAAQ